MAVRYNAFKPDKKKLVDEKVAVDYIATTQMKDYDKDPRYVDEAKRKKYFADGRQFTAWQSDPFLALDLYAQLQ